jgi:acetyl-CoA carboxylase biotin carboxylase subunit
MIRKLLIANRGEIAIRIARSAREMGIRTVAVCSETDRNAMHTEHCDEVVCIGGETALESYLIADRILEAAKKTGADAIHPGYGFLSEKAHFSKRCKDEGIVFVGPDPESIEQMGGKIESRELATSLGVPVTPGYVLPPELDDPVRLLEAEAERIGYPVLIKASAGGGGKGMRVVHNASSLEEAFDSVRNEARKAFADETVYLEKYLLQPRHIEFQILADRHGNVVALHERECSVQRRHQKIIEEAPSVLLDDDLRNRMAEAAVRIAKAVNYVNAGTMEFLVDANRNFYFLEMNTRLQVEHPITEMITGLDLVKLQLQIADGRSLTELLPDGGPAIRGHAIEARLYAEDPAAGFLPSIGRIDQYLEPVGPGIRVDSGVREGDEVSVHYDPMLAKLIVYDTNRNNCIERLKRALSDYCLLGPRTNLDYLYRIAESDGFVSGNYDTSLCDRINPTSESVDLLSQSLFHLGAALLGGARTTSRTIGVDQRSVWSGGFRCP